jgi:hypothetical protein
MLARRLWPVLRRLPGRPQADVQGEDLRDLRDLRDQIIRHKAQLDEETWQTAHATQRSAQGTPAPTQG